MTDKNKRILVTGGASVYPAPHKVSWFNLSKAIDTNEK